MLDGANDCCPCMGDELSGHINRCQAQCYGTILVVNVKFVKCFISLFVAVPSSTFSATNPGEEAVALQPQLTRSITGGWQKQEQLKRWEQEIEAVQPEKSKGKHQIFKLVC